MPQKNERQTYETVRETVEEYIDKNGLAADMRLPSERQLTEMLGVNRMTLRKAIAQMINENKLYAVKGEGLFVSPEKYIENTGDHISFTGAWTTDGYIVTSTVVSFKVVDADIKISQALEIPLGAPVHELIRLRCIDDDPVFIETSYVSVTRCPELNEYDFNGTLSLYATLEELYDIKIVRQQQIIRTKKMTSEEMQLFGNPGNENAYFFSAIGCDADGTPVEHSISTARADIFAISHTAHVTRP